MSFADDYNEELPVSYLIDNAILMHRDAHFGGDFQVMRDYYQKEGRGVSKEFEIKRIGELAALERQLKKNLASVMLSGAEAEKVALAKKAYKDLKELYQIKHPKNKLPLLIADLILAEDAEVPKAIAAVVAEKSLIVPLLVDLLRNEEFYDPLFPGYGLAPNLAAQCLGKIGDKRAVMPLFEAIGEGDFFNEDSILDALRQIGEPAKKFLLTVMHGRPLNRDNERAAIALIAFKEDPEVAKGCLHMLREIDFSSHIPLATYLILACEGLSSESDRQAFRDLIKHPALPKTLAQDVKAIAEIWK